MSIITLSLHSTSSARKEVKCGFEWKCYNIWECKAGAWCTLALLNAFTIAGYIIIVMHCKPFPDWPYSPAQNLSAVYRILMKLAKSIL